MNTIIIFTLNGCGHCKILKKKLDKLSILYTDIEVTENETIWKQVVEQTGHNSLPTVFVGLNGEDEGPIFVPERDYQSQEDLIEKIKIYV